MEELWHPIPGWEEYYSASSLGRVKRTAKRNFGHVMKENPRLLKGYPGVTLRRPGKNMTTTVHAVVAAAFHGPRPFGFEVNHMDGNKLNSRPENLEYVTPSENKRHAIDMQLGWVGEKNGSAKLTVEKVLEMRRMYVPRKFGFHRLAKHFGVTKAAIRAAYYGTTWAHTLNKEPNATT